MTCPTPGALVPRRYELEMFEDVWGVVLLSLCWLILISYDIL